MSVEELDLYVANGINIWGEPVRHVMEDGQLLVNQTRTSERTPLVTMLLTGGYICRCTIEVSVETYTSMSLLLDALGILHTLLG